MSSKGGVAPAYLLGHKWIAGVQTAWIRAGNHSTHITKGSVPPCTLDTGNPCRYDGCL